MLSLVSVELTIIVSARTGASLLPMKMFIESSQVLGHKYWAPSWAQTSYNHIELPVLNLLLIQVHVYIYI